MTMRNPDLLAVLMLGIATYRISRLVVLDTFPPAARLRKWFKYHWPDAGDTVHRHPKRGSVQQISPQGTDPRDVERWRVIEGTSLGYLISCMYCTPFWVGTALWLSWNWFPTATLFFCVPWVLSALGTLIYRWEQR